MQYLEGYLLDNRYQLERFVGSGTFGEVWVAIDKATDIEVAIKVYVSMDEKGLEEFKKIIDFAAGCKYNTVMLELGGALEYKSHPEINEGWLEYASFMNEYPGKTLVMQNCFGWEKNSIHSENGGGKIVPQNG